LQKSKTPRVIDEEQPLRINNERLMFRPASFNNLVTSILRKMLPPDEKHKTPGRMTQNARRMLQAFVTCKMLTVIKTATDINMNTQRPVVDRNAIIIAGRSIGIEKPPLPLKAASLTKRLCESRQIRQKAHIVSLEQNTKKRTELLKKTVHDAQREYDLAIENNFDHTEVEKLQQVLNRALNVESTTVLKLQKNSVRASLLLTNTNKSLMEANDQIAALSTKSSVEAKYPLGLSINRIQYPKMNPDLQNMDQSDNHSKSSATKQHSPCIQTSSDTNENEEQVVDSIMAH